MSLKSSKSVETNIYEIEVSVDGAAFKKAVDANYKKQIGKINVPGFRKGKAPKAIVEKMYGKGVFFDEAIDNTYVDALIEAEKEFGKKFVKVDEFKLLQNIDEIVPEDGYSFTVKVTVEPEIDVNDYMGIEVEKKSTEVTDEMLEEELKSVQERNSRMVTVEDRAAENGDFVVIDYKGMADGEYFEGGEAENYNLELGSNSFIPGFEEQIIGHSTGEEFDITVKFPEEYHAENLKGKDATFHIVLHEIKNKELPELDDDFAMDVSETANTLDEYKEELKKQIADRLESESQNQIDNSLNDAIIEKVEGDIPEVMFDREADDMVKEFDNQLRSQGLSIDQYCKYLGQDIKSIKAMYLEPAAKRVKLRLALDKIAAKENLEVLKEDIDAEIEKLAKMYNMEAEKIRELLPEDSIKSDLLREKAFKFVKDGIKTVEKKEAEDKDSETEKSDTEE